MRVNHQLEPLSEAQTEQTTRRDRLANMFARPRAWHWLRWGLLALVLLLALLGPGYLGDYNLTLAFALFNYITMAQAWNLVGGYGGQFSLGHSLFVGAGAYTVSVLLLHTGLPLYLIILLSGVLASALASIAALLLMRLREAYFSMVIHRPD